MSNRKKKIKKIEANNYLKIYLNNTVQLGKRIKDKKYEGSKVTGTDEREIAYNNERKVDVLNTYIFKSLANLIYFFEFLNTHPELIEKFEDDIIDLFGLKSTIGSSYTRLIRAILGKYSALPRLGYDDSKDDRFNYRRRLLNITQLIINQKALFYATKSLNLNDIRFGKMIKEDLDRADVWMTYLDRYGPNEVKELGRIIEP